MPTDLQLLKLFGDLPDIALSDMDKLSAREEIPEDMPHDLLAGRTCMHPDGYDEEVAEADPADLSHWLDFPEDDCHYVQQAMKLMEEYNNARWPKDCHQGESGYVVTRYIKWDSFPERNMRTCTSDELEQIIKAGVWNWTREYIYDTFASMPMAKVAMRLCDEAYRRVGVRHKDVDAKPAQIVLFCRNIPGSTEGIGWFPSGKCANSVEQHIDVTAKSLNWMARLLTHEHGHNHGEQHQFRNQSGPRGHYGIMSYSSPRHFYGFSTGDAPHVLPRDPSVDSLIEKYGGPLPDDPGMPPLPPDAPPTSGRPVIEGTLRIGNHEYIVVPKFEL